jgi:hypothetical protein
MNAIKDLLSVPWHPSVDNGQLSSVDCQIDVRVNSLHLLYAVNNFHSKLHLYGGDSLPQRQGCSSAC